MMDRKALYASLRRRDSGVFGTSLKKHQVEGCEAILDECIRQAADLGQTAYILATAYGETGAKMQPRRENLNYSVSGLLKTFGRHRISAADAKRLGRAGGRPAQQEAIANLIYGGTWGANNLGNTEYGDGWRFRGTGIPQLTGRRNFTRWSKLLGVNLEADPERLMELEMSVRALVRPMLEGWATGKKLSDYVSGDRRDYRGARAVWNHSSSAPDEYAAHAKAFEAALEAAGYNESAQIVQKVQIVQNPTTAADKPTDAPPAPPAVEVPEQREGLWVALLRLVMGWFGK